MCDCADLINKSLAIRNAAVSLPLIGPQRASIELVKLDEKKRGRLPTLLATYCPFCGVEYPSTKSEEPQQSGGYDATNPV